MTSNMGNSRSYIFKANASKPKDGFHHGLTCDIQLLHCCSKWGNLPAVNQLEIVEGQE